MNKLIKRIRKNTKVALAGAVLATGIGVAAAEPVAALETTYCGHGVGVDGLYSFRFQYEYQVFTSQYPFIKVIHVVGIYRKGGYRGSEWLFVETDTVTCH